MQTSTAFVTEKELAPARPMALHSPSAGFARPQPIITFNAGAEIYAPGDKATSYYHVEFGAVRIHRLLSDGRRQVIAFHLAGETFGFEADRTHSFFAEAITQAGLRTIARPANDEASPEMLSLALRGMMRAQEHIMMIGRQTAVERIAGFLLDMAERQGGLEHFDLPMTRLDIADYLGLTIETVSRVFAKLRASGLIKLRSIRCVEISKHEALGSLCA
ncbi:helix-turn-helix domain-containing protein [Rhizobium sp. XQZ8]|uniref:helix-turn-helix domain-containing protein n=1 Tax=Rhizobium populisoli TaxID=2859785 RepID=UPI001CA59F6C|nr:helix-turn-helix domain-containing protein [Rhizobium populisoli]MBW6422782.1 helix-turn-helix domain-containing protein [Rhizobium populisoli]